METNTEIAPAGAGVIENHYARPVLAAVDLQPGSDKLILWACEHAQSLNAPVVILHIVHDPAASLGFYSNSPHAEKPLEPMEIVAERMMTSLLDDLKAGHPDLPPLLEANTHLETGIPKTRIGEIAEKLNARLLVIGRPKQNGMKNFLKSSISGHLEKKANVPIVVL